MFASVRQYRTSDVSEIARQINEGFLPLIRDVPGFSGYYVVDGGGGTLITVTLAENQAGADASAERAAGWIQENPNVAQLIEGSPNVTNGEVVAQA
jgi:hypothetical protein